MVKQIFEKALIQGFALGAFNFVNLEILKAIIAASEEKDAYVIASVSEGALKYIEPMYLKGMIIATKLKPHNKVIFHLDHGKSLESCKLAIELGFDSVMIDASDLPFEDNVSLTKQVCDYAQPRGIFVEGELGVLAGVEDDVSAEHSVFTDPIQAKEFVKKTGVDSLAIAIGTSHGAYKFSGEPKLSMERLTEIQNLLPNQALVLHGASSVYEKDTNKFNFYGGKLVGTKGVPDSVLTDVCKNYNICKVNTDTDLRICFLANLKESLAKEKTELDIRKHLNYASDATKELVKNKIVIFGQ